MFSILWLTEFVLQFVAASASVSSSLSQQQDCNRTVCAQTCHLPLHPRLSPGAEDPTLRCTAASAAICSCTRGGGGGVKQHFPLPSAGCKEPGSAGLIPTYQFQKFFVPRSHGRVRRDAPPQDEVPKGYAFAKTCGEKSLITQILLHPQISSVLMCVPCGGVCLIIRDGFNGQD